MNSKIIERKSKLDLLISKLEAMKSKLEKADNIDLQLEDISSKREELQGSVHFMSNGNFAQISEELVVKKKQLEKRRNKDQKDKIATVDKSEYECVICLTIPANEVWSCGMECDNIICNDCKGKLKSCPTCRANVKRNPLRRNRTAEKILQK